MTPKKRAPGTGSDPAGRDKQRVRAATNKLARSADSIDVERMLVTLKVAELREVVRTEVDDALDDLGRVPAPALVDRAGLAAAIGASLSSVDRLRREGAPEVRVGDAPRFRVERVIAWLEEREGSSSPEWRTSTRGMSVIEGGRS